MAGAGAESPVAVAESHANGKGPEEDLEKEKAIEHLEEGGDEKEELHESEVLTGETGNEAEGEKSAVPEDVKAESVLEEAVKANQVETPKKRRGKAPALKSPSKEGESTVTESRKRNTKELTTTPSDRPSRERKTIERFVASTEKETSKEIAIEKGKGTLLKDIPNVAFQVSKRSRADDSLKTLHFVLYRRRVKASHIKNNVLQFSGFIWGEDEEKQKMHLKVKLDKLNKEVLFNMCDILDIQGIKSSTKKEEVVAKLIEFLEAPHVTRDVLLEERIEKLKSKKRKKRSKGTSGKAAGKSSGKTPPKKRKKSVGSKEEREPPEGDSEGDEEVEEENGDKESDLGEEEDAPGSEKEAEDDEDYGVGKGSKRSTKKQSNKRKRNQNADKKNLGSSPKKGLRSPSKGGTPKASGNAVSSPKHSPSSKVFSRKTKKQEVEVDKPASEGKKQGRKKAKASVAKSNSKEKDGETKAKGKPDTLDPSDEELRSAIADILKGVDFNTATFTDIVKQLAGRFDTDLSERKGPVKVLIQEELSKLAVEADDGDDDEDQSIGVDGNMEKDESDEMTGQVVEAE